MTNPAVPTAPTSPRAGRHIGILVFDDVEELDAVGPWAVLSNWTLHHPEDGWTVSCVSRDGSPVRAAKGSRWVPTGRSRPCHPSRSSSTPAARAPAA